MIQASKFFLKLTSILLPVVLKSADSLTLSETQTTEEQDPPPAKKKKGCRGCLVSLGVLTLLLIALLAGSLLWLNGPGFRWLAQKYGPDFLAQNGIEGDFQLSGTLLNGPTIDSINISSETSPLKNLQATNLRLDYDIRELKDFKIKSLTADSLTLDLDLAQTDPESEKEDEEEDTSAEPLSELLARYRPLAIHPELVIEELNLHVHKGDQNFYRLQEASLSHASQSGICLLYTSPSPRDQRGSRMPSSA